MHDVYQYEEDFEDFEHASKCHIFLTFIHETKSVSFLCRLHIRFHIHLRKRFYGDTGPGVRII